MTEQQMKHKEILVDKDCKECNCFEDCLKYSKMKKYLVIKDSEGCCEVRIVKLEK